MHNTDERDRARALVILHQIDPAVAEAADNAPLPVLEKLLAQARASSGVVGGVNLSPEGYVSELARIRMQRALRPRAVVTGPSGDPSETDAASDHVPTPKKSATSSEDEGLAAGIDKLAQQTYPDDPKKCQEYTAKLRRILMGGGK